MGRQHTNRGALLASNLPQLQNLIKRDPVGYRDEFLQQWNHYNSIREIFQLKPDEQAQTHFRELTSFIAQVAPCFPKETVEFPKHLSEMLLVNYAALTPDMRRNLVQNLVMLRNKDVIPSITLLQTLFPLLPRATSATLRTFIRKTILTDIKTANMKTKNHKLNKAVQAMLFGMVERGMDGEVTGDKGKAKEGAAGEASRLHGGEAMWAVILTKELWKKGICADAKTVSILALGCFHPVAKVQSAALHFFLGSEDENSEDSEAEEEDIDVKGFQHRNIINKKKKSGERKMEKVVKAARKKRIRDANKEATPNFPAIQLLNDPQTFGERLYENLSKYDKRYSLDHKVLIMRLLSRVMGAHQLCVLSFYSYILKYLTYHQLQVTSILVCLAQSVHELTPPDVLTPVIRKIAQEFIHPGVGGEVIAAGLNSIREVCKRQPWCMEEDLLGDLVEYKKSRDKGVMVAARGLLQLYRDVNPGMLKKSQRGKEASMNSKLHQPLPYGHTADAQVNIEGLDLLEAHIEAQRSAVASGGDGMEVDEEDDVAAWEGWDVESDSDGSSDAEEGWQDVSSDEGDLVVDMSDSEDEGKRAKRKGKGKVEEEEGQKEEGQNTEEKVEEGAVQNLSTLATTKILTPADFALLNELRLKAASEAVEKGGGSAAKRKLSALEATRKSNASDPHGNAFLSESDLLGPRKKAKADYEERMASIQTGREGREKFGSLRGKKGKVNPSSSTNKEKAKKKPFMMVMASGAVRGKKKASLKEKQKKLRRHIEKSKKGGH